MSEVMMSFHKLLLFTPSRKFSVFPLSIFTWNLIYFILLRHCDSQNKWHHASCLILGIFFFEILGFFRRMLWNLWHFNMTEWYFLLRINVFKRSEEGSLSKNSRERKLLLLLCRISLSIVEDKFNCLGSVRLVVY